MAEEIKINIGADSSKLQAELQKAQNELKAFEAQLRKSTDVNEITKLQTNIKGLETQIASLKGGMQKLAPVSNTATQSLTNLSRVAQDAPFGFIGIANNLNPLLESFQRLQAETGSTKNAFKTLIGSLAGPAGLGLAVGVISSLLVTFGDQLFSTGKKADESAKENEKFAKSLREAEGSALASAQKLQMYVDIARDSTLPLAQRNEALDMANKIMGEHGEKLTLVNVGTEKTTRAIELFTQATVAQAVATKYSDKLADLLIKKNEVLAKQQTQQAAAATAQSQAVATADKAQQRRFGTSEAAAVSAYNSAINNNNAQQQLIDTGKELATVQNEIANINKLLTQTTLESTAAFGELGKKPKEAAKKAKKEIETIPGVLKTLDESLANAIQIGIALKTPKPDVVKEEVKLIEGAIQKLISDLNVAPDDAIIKGLKAQINLLGSQFNNAPLDKIFLTTSDKVQALENQLKKLQNQLKTTFTPEGITQLKTQIGSIEQEITKLGGRTGLVGIKILPKIEIPEIDTKQLANVTESVNKFILDSFNNLAIGIGEALGAALSGEQIGGFFDGILKVIGVGLQELGKAFIAGAELIKLIKDTLSLRPELALIAGIALVALGTVIANQVGKKQAFAVGTRNAPGGVALVGERGPELVSLPGGSQVVPAAQTAAMMGGVGGSIEVFGMLRGQDIYFSNKKYGQTYGRTT